MRRESEQLTRRQKVWISAAAGPWRRGRRQIENKINCVATILIILRGRVTAGPEPA
jgi:hypothetical protein